MANNGIEPLRIIIVKQKQLLLSDYERIGLDEYRQSIKLRQSKARYDASGFGDQQVLARAIRSSAEDIPLESLLESIKIKTLKILQFDRFHEVFLLLIKYTS